MQIEQAANALQGIRQEPDLMVRGKRDLVSERDENGTIAGGPNGHIMAMLPSRDQAATLAGSISFIFA